MSDMTYSITRYLCPLGGCGWFYDDDGTGFLGVEPFEPQPSVLPVTGVMEQIVIRHAQAHARYVEAVLCAHMLNVHGLATRQEVRAEIARQPYLGEPEFDVPVAPV